VRGAAGGGPRGGGEVAGEETGVEEAEGVGDDAGGRAAAWGANCCCQRCQATAEVPSAAFSLSESGRPWSRSA
jgi:hypothetical protein